MAQRRQALSQLEARRARAAHHMEAITTETLKAWHEAINRAHSQGYKPVSYEPAVSSSNEPAMPTLDRDDHHLEYNARQVIDALVQIERLTRLIETQFIQMTTLTKRMEDPEPRPCSNVHCPDTRIFTMIGRDRPANSKGECPACYAYQQRTGTERTARRGATV